VLLPNLKEMRMAKKTDQLRQLVHEMGDRYGADDVDVQRLQQELQALERTDVVKPVERRKLQVCRYSFGSLARQHYNDPQASLPPQRP
jgi:hypothetical protein